MRRRQKQYRDRMRESSVQEISKLYFEGGCGGGNGQQRSLLGENWWGIAIFITCVRTTDGNMQGKDFREI